MVRRESAEGSRTPAAALAADAGRDTGMETVMGWLSLYVPTWGTSVVLHGAALLVACFIAWAYTSPPVWHAPGTIDLEPRPNVQSREKTERPVDESMEDDRESRGNLMPQKFSPAIQPLTDAPPGFGQTPDLDPSGIIGIGSDRLGGATQGLGDGDGRGRGLFDPVDGACRKVVYVVDRSGSMTDSIDYVKYELKRSIGDLSEGQEFHVIFFASGPPVEMPARRLVSATEWNKARAFEFIDGVIAQTETDPTEALRRALACKPDVVYLLTDGEFDRQVIGLVRLWNAGKKVAVHTIGFLYTRPGTDAEQVLRTIAAENGGRYQFVSEQDLAVLGGP